MARWQIGYATDCKSVKVGSIPARASTWLLLLSKAPLPMWPKLLFYTYCNSPLPFRKGKYRYYRSPLCVLMSQANTVITINA